MKRIKLFVNNLTGEDPFGNREDVADEFAGHFGDVSLMICRLNALIESWCLPNSLRLVVRHSPRVCQRWLGANQGLWCHSPYEVVHLQILRVRYTTDLRTKTISPVND